MTALKRTDARSLHRVSPAWRWTLVPMVPPLIALMSWAAFESVHNNLSDDGEIQLWVILLSCLIFGGLSVVFLAGLLWAFRARVVIDGERMTIRGAFTTTIVTPQQLNGFRYLNGQFHFYLKHRRWPVPIAYYEDLWVITHWIQQRTTDILAELIKEEDTAISSNTRLGYSEAEKASHLEALRKKIHLVNLLVYIAASLAFVNYLFLEHSLVELTFIGLLVLMPVYLDLLALSNRGYIRIDYDEGSRYPQILTGTLVAGTTVALLSLLDRGALLDNEFYEVLFVVALAKGLLWCFIDKDRLKVMLARGPTVAAISVVAMFAIPAFWVGGSLYQANKHLDTSPTSWHATEVIEKVISSGRITRYSVTLAPWNPAQTDAVDLTLRRAEFNRLDEGMSVQVGVRQGALGLPWVSDLVPAVELAAASVPIVNSSQAACR